jgi:S-DNA-T family DNA segregation ATPase FtsK/SpoIIIE
MKKNSLRINFNRLILNIVVILIIISLACTLFSKGSFSIFIKFFVISVVIFAVIIFLLLIFIYFSSPKSKKYTQGKKKQELVEKVEGKEIINKKEHGSWVTDISIFDSKDIFVVPPLSLLEGDYMSTYDKQVTKEDLNISEKIKIILAEHKIKINIKDIIKGLQVTRYEIEPCLGAKVSEIASLKDYIINSLGIDKLRMDIPNSGKPLIAIEIPRYDANNILLKQIIASVDFKKSESEISFALGKDIYGNNIIADIAKMSNLLIAGGRESGKSVCIHSIILSLIFKGLNEKVKFLLIDLKDEELAIYNGIPHLLMPVIAGSEKAVEILNWILSEVNKRKKLFSEKKCLDIESYNRKSPKKLEKILIIIDEYKDLMLTKQSIENLLCDIARNSRSTGIYLVISTQRTSQNVITPNIKTNFQTRIAFSVVSQKDSITILDNKDAEKLIGDGDMIFYRVGQKKSYRLKGALVTRKEIERIVNYIKR